MAADLEECERQCGDDDVASRGSDAKSEGGDGILHGRKAVGQRREKEAIRRDESELYEC